MIEGAEFQSTTTDKLIEEPWLCQVGFDDVGVHKRRHHRLVLGTVGYALKTVRGTDELLHATYDVFVGMSNIFYIRRPRR